MEDTIVRKWIGGLSPEQIARWVENSNSRRVVPVQTSRSSIERLLVQARERDNSIGPLRCVLQVRREAPRYLERLDEITDEYRSLGEERPFYRTSEEARIGKLAKSERLHAHSKEERSLIRKLRIAGVDSGGGERLLKTRRHDVRDLEKEITDEAEVADFIENMAQDMVAGRTLDVLAALPTDLCAPPDAQENVRLESASTEKPSEFEPRPVRLDPTLLQGIPFITDPEWSLPPEQRELWQRTKGVIHGFLLAARSFNGAPLEIEALQKPLPPQPTTLAGLVVADAIPLLQLPDWPLTASQQEVLESQMKVVNAWLLWLRKEIVQAATGRDDWRRLKSRTDVTDLRQR
jgi:hypothetical protein